MTTFDPYSCLGQAKAGSSQGAEQSTALVLTPSGAPAGALAVRAQPMEVKLEALTAAMTPERPGDPLQTGLARPPPPRDPDAFTREVEMEGYTLGFLSDEARAEVEQELAKHGHWTIDDVRANLRGGDDAKTEDYEAAGGVSPELMVEIDPRIDFKVFLYGDNVYSRDELYTSFALHEFNVQPESLFSQQEIEVYEKTGMYDAREFAVPQQREDTPLSRLILGHRDFETSDQYEYVARDVTERLIERRVHPCDQILAHRPDYRPRRLLGVFKTKFFVGRGKWRDFIQLSGSTRAALGIAQAQMRHQGEVSGLVRMVLGLNTAPAAGALTSGAKGDK